MTKGTKITIAIASILGLAGLAYFASRKFDDTIEKITGKLSGSKKDTDYDTGKNVHTGGTTGWIPSASVFPLKKGSRGNEVRNVQRAINAMLSAGLFPYVVIKNSSGDVVSKVGEDSIWGTQTENALKDMKLKTTISKDEYFKMLNSAEKLGYKGASGIASRNRNIMQNRQLQKQHLQKQQLQLQKQQLQKRKIQQNNTEKLRKAMLIERTAEGLLQSIHASDFVNQRVFYEFGDLRDDDFVKIYKLYNNINMNKLGNDRTLAEDIRGTSMIENEEQLLKRIFNLNLEK